MLVTNTAFFSWNSVLFINKIPIHVRNLVFILIDVLIQAKKKEERARRNELQRSEYKEQTDTLFKILNESNGSRSLNFPWLFCAKLANLILLMFIHVIQI